MFHQNHSFFATSRHSRCNIFAWSCFRNNVIVSLKRFNKILKFLWYIERAKHSKKGGARLHLTTHTHIYTHTHTHTHTLRPCRLYERIIFIGQMLWFLRMKNIGLKIYVLICKSLIDFMKLVFPTMSHSS